MVGYERTVIVSKFKNERVTNCPPAPLLAYKGLWKEGGGGEGAGRGEKFPIVPENIQNDKYFPLRWFKVVGGGEGVVGGGGGGGGGGKGVWGVIVLSLGGGGRGGGGGGRGM